MVRINFPPRESIRLADRLNFRASMFADSGLPIEIIAMPEGSGQECRLWANVRWDACVFLSLHLYLAFLPCKHVSDMAVHMILQASSL